MSHKPLVKYAVPVYINGLHNHFLGNHSIIHMFTRIIIGYRVTFEPFKPIGDAFETKVVLGVVMLFVYLPVPQW